MKKATVLLAIIATLSFGCSPESTEQTDSMQKSSATDTAPSSQPVSPEASATIDPMPTPEEIKSLFSAISSLKVDFEKAIQEKNLDLHHKTKAKWEEENKTLDSLIEKYSPGAIYNSPVKDCEETFYHMYQAYVVFWGGATNPSDDRERRAYEEDRDKLSKLFDECKLSVEAGKSSAARNPES